MNNKQQSFYLFCVFFIILHAQISIMKSLTIYKASAGSGKTYRLAMDYINLLLHNPSSYESILAVTFTNKATAEMKRRILMELWAVTQESERSIKERQNARQALSLLLENYHFFRVQTIDTFFQTVLRNLAHELQLNANLRVSLSTEEVVSEAVDDLIDTLADDKKLKRIVMNYVMDSMNDGKKWNIIGDIKKFGSTIFKEYYKVNRNKLEEVFKNEDFFDNYQKTLRVLRDSVCGKYKEEAQKVLDEMRKRGLSEDNFASKTRGPISYFLKLSQGFFYDEKNLMNKTVNEAKEDPTKWYTKSNAGDAVLTSFVSDIILPAIEKIEKTRKQDAKDYNSVVVTLKHLNEMRLLARIEDCAHNLNAAAQRFMLSDTQTLLHEIIGDDDAPFIFEKIGSRLKHVMIDEFQDTSTVQWKNFQTLLKECMSISNETDDDLCNNLIVGDVKQSIYRFRSGDWRLLNDLETSFPGVSEVRNLSTNWRSWRNIVEFNNVFLRKVIDAEISSIEDERWQSDLQRAYADLEQNVAPRNQNTQGLVHIELLPKNQLPDTPAKIYDIVCQLVEKGASYNDIAILVRRRQEVREIADYLEGNDVHVLSAEAFRLESSQNVMAIVNAMKLVSHPNDDLSKAYLKLTYPNILPLIEEQRQELVQKTLHDLAESLVLMIGCTEPAFITAFFDVLESFSNDISPILDDFLAAWDEELYKNMIETANGDGIIIMTIHKSKGLEFNHVIVPYCNWDADPPFANTLWVEPKEHPFSQLPLVPVDYKTKDSLKNTIYEKYGTEESIQSVVDNFNLLYVALTRPCQSLFVLGERNSDEKSRSYLMQTALLSMQEMQTIDGKELHFNGVENADAPLTFTFGSLDATNKEEREKKKNPFALPVDVEEVFSLPSFKTSVNYRQSNAAQRFAADDNMDDQLRARLSGTEQHWIFSHIKTLDDVPPEYEDVFKDEQVRQWFNPHWKVFNECSIITESGEYRPDRVITDEKQTIVIDFKFGSPHQGYESQVRRYMQLLAKMGYPQVQGFLWYINASSPSERIVPVSFAK